MEFLSSPSCPSTPVRKQSSHNRNRSDDSSVFTPTKSADSSVLVSDRFIPNRSSIDFDYCSFALQTNENEFNVGGKIQTPGSSAKTPSAAVNNTQERLKKEILQSPSRKRLMDCFDRRDTPSTRSSSFDELDSGLSPASMNITKMFDSGQSDLSSSSSAPKKVMRSLPAGPSRVLDCPELMDDYYLNLLDWGHNNIIAVALRKAVYLWNAANGEITNLVTLPETSDYVSSLQWNRKDNTIAVGTFNNIVEIWDADAQCKIRELTGHNARISSLSWNSQYMLSSGGRDSKILNYDVRQRDPVTHTYRGHEQEICGLAW
jgi:WD40 repeat protein